jgi:hypothetical protein
MFVKTALTNQPRILLNILLKLIFQGLPGFLALAVFCYH